MSAEHAQLIAGAGPDPGRSAALGDGPGGLVGWVVVFTCCLSIAGGTSEITRNQIAERILGLPGDPLLR